LKLLTVVQHTSADYLGLIEDHLEGRRIRFQYFRPFAAGGRLPDRNALGDGLFLLGGGPWGTAGVRDVPNLEAELRLARVCLMLDKPVIGIELGAQILSLAAEGKTSAAPLTFQAGYATRKVDDALNGYLPPKHPHIVFIRDRPEPPAYARILSEDAEGAPAIFQVGPKAFGFVGHPGFKLAMAEDLLMEFEETPENPAAQLARLAGMKREIEDALVPLMTGLIQMTGLMDEKK
jgi:GMP synthase-like glutamine amidotransferase